jgi:hypothetical protein
MTYEYIVSLTNALLFPTVTPHSHFLYIKMLLSNEGAVDVDRACTAKTIMITDQPHRARESIANLFRRRYVPRIR